MRPTTAFTLSWLAPGLLAAGLLTAPSARATQAEHVRAEHAWIRILPAGLPAGGYLTLRNEGDAPAALTGASSPRYAKVMLHQTTASAGTASMHMVEQLPVPPHGTVTLAPGGYHLMFSGAPTPVRPGNTVPVTLRFADGSTLPVQFQARPANAVGAN